MKTYKIIAATGCPTGIAHTYMAQEALEEAAKKRGISIKVETHGQDGIKNALTDEEIDAADGIIIAADKDVNIDRFIGKPLINVPVSKGIKEPEKLIDAILSGNASVYKDGQAKKDRPSQSLQKTSYWHTIYAALMNGVSHMLPLVVAGGVMVAISFMFGINSADPKSPEYNQFAYYLKTIGGIAMNLMVPVLCAYISEAIAKRPGLIIGFIVGMIAYINGTGFLGGIVGGFLAGYIMLGLAFLLKRLPKQLNGLKSIFLYPVLGIFIAGFAMWFLSAPMESINKGMMNFLTGVQDYNPILLDLIVGCMCAFDMGGPVNKAAYVTGTALLAQGNYFFMAGVSAACIAPPLATGFAVLFGRKAYSASERSAGYVNFLLGSTHITEGAIPFAAKKPLKVIPMLMLGSSIAAILTYMFKVQVPAPHGGFIVLPIVKHALLWVLAILIGSIIGGFLMSVDQKRSAAKKQSDQEKQADSEQKSLSEQENQEDNDSKNLAQVFDIRNIDCKVQASTQKEVFQKLAKMAKQNWICSDENEVIKGFIAREKLSTTGMEKGIAIPHTELESIKKSSIAILKLTQGVDWKALDGEPTKIVIAMFIPKGKANDHLKYLSEVSKRLVHQDFIDQLYQAENAEEIYQLFLKNAG
ncbi:fructose-specific PTS transporter subunit EIIC [Scopulibacillus cellulosilyticus]|uniref:Fructose-specific PTS transporter subunit EIIC n=1 Tax=Scopulibacillus cellulosilyticus TaxID=2665665 RepID=A0ABW2Q204_9BACL